MQFEGHAVGRGYAVRRGCCRKRYAVRKGSAVGRVMLFEGLCLTPHCGSSIFLDLVTDRICAMLYRINQKKLINSLQYVLAMSSAKEEITDFVDRTLKSSRLRRPA